jgi:hypothetical protein
MNRKKGCSCGDMDRRLFLKLAGASGAAAAFSGLPAMAGPFETADFEKLVPADKKLDPAWVKSLFARGEPAVYRGRELDLVGMPVGGLCAGMLYLGGDGKLWGWDIFNRIYGTGAGHYAEPLKPSAPLAQGFAIRVSFSGTTQVRALDRTGFSDIGFRGEYPMATVDYRDPASPVAVRLEAYSPFIPLATDASSLPATVMRFTVRNTSEAKVTARLAGWLENAVCLHSGLPPGGKKVNRVTHAHGMSFLQCAAAAAGGKQEPARPDEVFEDWNKETYEGWTVEGSTFGTGPTPTAS